MLGEPCRRYATGRGYGPPAQAARHPATTRSIYPRRVHLIDDQVGIAIGEDLVHSIDQRAEWPNRSIHTIHALERNKHATPTLLER